MNSRTQVAACPPIQAVTFDAGQTLIDLDTELLATRLAERGVTVADTALAAAAPAAWRTYDAAVAAGAGHPWRVLMSALLANAGLADPSRRAELVEWLWHEQPTKNLWRRPIPGMFELAARLRAAGLAVAVLSNSEGRLAELFAEQGWAAGFAVITDSGRLGIEKPDPRIFEHTVAALRVEAAATVHIGDSWPADVEGALGAGLRAIWFGRHAVAEREAPASTRSATVSSAQASNGGRAAADQRAGAARVDRHRVASAGDAAEVAAILGEWGASL